MPRTRPEAACGKRLVAEATLVVCRPRAWLVQPEVDDESYGPELLYKTWTCYPRDVSSGDQECLDNLDPTGRENRS